MVKSYEREQPEQLNEREVKVLLTILFRRIEDAYKQFKWETINRDYDGFITTKLASGNYTVYVLVNKRIGEVVRVTCSLEDRVSKKSIGRAQAEQRFPIVSKTPRELGKLANTIFRWVKQQMEKL